MSQQSTGGSKWERKRGNRTPATHEDDRLVVSIAVAMRLLSMSRTTLYRRITAGEIIVSRDHGRTKPILSSLKEYISRGVEEASERRAQKLLREAQAER